MHMHTGQLKTLTTLMSVELRSRPVTGYSSQEANLGEVQEMGIKTDIALTS